MIIALRDQLMIPVRVNQFPAHRSAPECRVVRVRVERSHSARSCAHDHCPLRDFPMPDVRGTTTCGRRSATLLSSAKQSATVPCSSALPAPTTLRLLSDTCSTRRALLPRETDKDFRDG